MITSNILTYAKAGIETANWKSNGVFRSRNKSYTVKQNRRARGIVLGLGVETMVSQHVMIGGEWAYTMYNKAAKITFTNPATNAVQNDTFEPRTADFRLRASYKW